FLEKDLIVKKDELSAYSNEVDSDLKVEARRAMKNVEVPTGEKTIFGKEKTKTEKKPTKNVIISENDYKKLVTAERDNTKLKTHNNYKRKNYIKKKKNKKKKKTK